MATSRIYNVRDAFWLMPSSSNGYLTDSSNNLSVQDNFIGYDTDTVGSGSPYEDNYILFHGTGQNQHYYFRTDDDPIVPTSIAVNMHASNIQSKLYVNDVEVGDIGTFGDTPETIFTNLNLTSDIRKEVLRNRNEVKYNTFSITSEVAPVSTGIISGTVYGLVLDSVGPGALSGGDDDGVIAVTSTTTPSSGIYDGEEFTLRMTIDNNSGGPLTSTTVGALPNIALSKNPAYPFDLVYVSSNPVASTVNDEYWEWGSWSMGIGESRTWDLTLQIHGTGIPPATSPENQSTQFELQGGQYVSQLMYFDTDSAASGGTQDYTYNTAIYGFELDLENTDDGTYNNYINDANISSLYMTLESASNSHCEWKTDAEAAIDYTVIDVPPTGVNADTNYLYLNSYNQSTPSGYLELGFASNIINDSDLGVTRAILQTNISFPPSSTQGNYRDYFDILGDNGTEVFLWGNGEIVENSGFLTYTNDLFFTDGDLFASNSGDTSSRNNATLANFENLNIKYVGLPSGTQLSAVSLEVEHYPSNVTNLFVEGVAAVTSGITNMQILGALETASMTVYMSGNPPYNNFDLVMPNVISSSNANATMFTHGHEEINSLSDVYSDVYDDIFSDVFGSGTLFTMYMYGIGSGTTYSSMFIQGLDPPEASGTTTLRVKGNTESDVIGQNNLFLKSYDYDPDSSIPLFINNGGENSSYKSVNLLIGNTLPSYTDLSLYIQNDTSDIDSSVNMFIKPSFYYNFNDSLNLHINRDNDGIHHELYMHIEAPLLASSTIPTTAFIKGTYLLNENDFYHPSSYAGAWGLDEVIYPLYMVISGHHYPNSDTDLFIGGY